MTDLPTPDESPTTDDQVDEAFAAYLRSCDANEIGSREEFLAQFPDIAGDLKELMEAADLISSVSMADQSTTMDRPKAASGADTIGSNVPNADDSGADPAATLPMANRAKGDPGPTLPFDLGDYQLLEVIGRGGMGVVYLAKQNHLDRMVAVKMIRSGMLADDDEVRRFYTEAQAAARLHHPGIVAVYQFGHRAGHHFFSMEYVRGVDLQKRINSEILDPKLAARYVRDVAKAIGHAHANDVLHRDLKPANVLIDLDDQVHVTDFGLAKHLDGDSSVTRSGAAVGTPHYMAPEQAGGHSDRASKQSDVYSLGAILFACVAGRPPLVGDTVVQTLMQVVHNPAPLLRTLRSDAPRDLETIVAKCLEKNPAKRYESADDLAAELDAFLEGRPIAARPRSRAMKTWHWIEGVPIVGALMGRNVVETSASHRRFQAAMLLMMLSTPLAIVGSYRLWHYNDDAIPSNVHIAGGLDGGIYNDFSRRLAERVQASHNVQTEIVRSGGSFDNCDRLLQREVDLAPMQASALNGQQDLCVVAPMFFEAVHVLVQTDTNITRVEELRGHTVAVGPNGSGSRKTAELLFKSLNLGSKITPREVAGWSELNSDQATDAAVICIGPGSDLVSQLLTNGRWRLVPIPTSVDVALRHPRLRPMNIMPDQYATAEIPEIGIPTVGTTAYLAARTDTPGELVQSALDALYAKPTIYPRLIPRSRTAEWQALDFHPVAREFFRDAE